MKGFPAIGDMWSCDKFGRSYQAEKPRYADILFVRKGGQGPLGWVACHSEFHNGFYTLADIENFPESGLLSTSDNIILVEVQQKKKKVFSVQLLSGAKGA